jgi:hypothetical protein
MITLSSTTITIITTTTTIQWPYIQNINLLL